jgi:Uma2 family endonuclease
MSTRPRPTADNRIVLRFAPLLRHITEDDFFDFCVENPDWRIERSPEGDLIVMAPTGGETGRRNFRLNLEFGNWVKKDGTGEGFDSSTIFALPNGAKRSPDLSWVRRDRWAELTDEQRRGFPPLCPDFVVELRSHTDSLRVLQEKMQEYIANGAQLGWLLDAIERQVYIYQPGKEVECLNDPGAISGDPLLPGFTLDLSEIW